MKTWALITWALLSSPTPDEHVYILEVKNYDKEQDCLNIKDTLRIYEDKHDVAYMCLENQK